MKKLALLLLAPTLCFAQTQIGPASGTNAGIQIGGNQPGVSSIQGQTGDFTFNGDGFSGCSTDAGVTTCTFTGGGSGISLTTNRQSGKSTLSTSVLNVPAYPGGNVYNLPNFSSLVGAFTDGSGNVIEPIAIGNGPVTFYIPAGASQLQLGVNDDLLSDATGSWTISVNGTNYTVPGATPPWSNTAGANPGYPIYDGTTAPFVIVPVGIVGTPVTIQYVSGTINNYQYCGLSAFVPFDASGQADCALTAGNFGTLPAMWTLSADAAGSGTSGVTSIDSLTGAFTFGGSGVSHTGNAYTFSGGTVPGGTTTQLQYNNAGAFGGDTGSTTDGAGNVTHKTVSTTGTVAGQGGTWNATEGTAPSAASGHDLLYADSTSHCIKLSNNGGSFSCIGTGGTVTSVSVTTANGVSGSVATATTTPAITLTLGAITPTSVVPSTPIAHANIASTAVTPGSYTNTNLTVAADGSITAASNGSGGSGTITATGSPASGNLTKFSGATSITNGDLSGDCTTSGTLALTCTKTSGTAFTGLATLAGSTAGDLAYFNGTIWTRLAGNASGTQYLTENSSGVPAWGTISHPWSCQTGIYSGAAISAATYAVFDCVNDTGSTITLSGIRCYVDNSSATSTVNMANNAGTGMLSGAITCTNTKTNGGAAGTLTTTTLAAGDALNFSFVADGTTKQSLWTVTGSY